MKTLLMICSLCYLSLNLYSQRLTNDGQFLKAVSEAKKLYQQKDFLASALRYDQAFKLENVKNHPTDAYNAACSWALAGGTAKALYYLEKAVFKGHWSRYEHILRDKDLASLHYESRWTSIIDAVKKNQALKNASLNKELIAFLDTIYFDDQNLRHKLDSVQKGLINGLSDSALLKEIKIKDSINLNKISFLLEKHGWPDVDEITAKGSFTIFMVIQHADPVTQVRYMPMIKKAVRKRNLSGRDLALIQDRIAVSKGEPQRYGTQLGYDSVSKKYHFLPIHREKNVNKRRAKLGLEPLEEYAKDFNIIYSHK